MALKALLKTLDGLTDEVKALYKQQDDKTYRLDVDDVVDKDKFLEFRESNIAMKAELDQMKQTLEKFKGIDPAKYNELRKKMANLEEEKLLADGKLDEVIRLRTEQMQSSHQEQLSAKDKLIKDLETERGKAHTERDQYIIDAELRRAVENPEYGFEAGVADVLRPHVLKEFTYTNNKVSRVKPDGSVFYGKNGEPATLAEYLADQAKEKPFLVKRSNGGGAPPKQPSGNNGNRKTMRRAEFDGLEDRAKSDFAKSGGQLVD